MVIKQFGGYSYRKPRPNRSSDKPGYWQYYQGGGRWSTDYLYAKVYKEAKQ